MRSSGSARLLMAGVPILATDAAVARWRLGMAPLHGHLKRRRVYTEQFSGEELRAREVSGVIHALEKGVCFDSANSVKIPGTPEILFFRHSCSQKPTQERLVLLDRRPGELTTEPIFAFN